MKVLFSEKHYNNFIYLILQCTDFVFVTKRGLSQQGKKIGRQHMTVGCWKTYVGLEGRKQQNVRTEFIMMSLIDDSNYLPNITGMIKSKRIKWPGHAARI
jgi:hypothetical protein